jgi:hypothetical protein
MAEATEKAPAQKGPKHKNLQGAELIAHRALRRRLRRAGNKKRDLKLRTDKEFAKTFFEGRSKRSNDKKSTFRKKKSRKK